MVQETFEPGASVARVAQRHAINANQLFLWRKLYREGLLGENSNSEPASGKRFGCGGELRSSGQWRAATVGIIRYDPRRDSQRISRQTHHEGRRFAPKHLCRSVKKLVRALVAFSSFPDLVDSVRYMIMKLS